MKFTSLTLVLSLTAFTISGADEKAALAPRNLKRMAISDVFDPEATIELSNEHGPQTDGQTEIIDVIKLDNVELQNGQIAAYRMRFQKVDGDIAQTIPAQNLGNAAKKYLDTYDGNEVGTDSLADMLQNQSLYQAWQTAIVIEKDDGTFEAYDIGNTSVEFSKDNTFAIQHGDKVAIAEAGDTLSLLTSGKAAIMRYLVSEGFTLQGDGEFFLVRAPTHNDAAFVVVNADTWMQSVYDNNFQLVDMNDMRHREDDSVPVLVMPAIDPNGKREIGKVTTSSGKGDSWTNDIGIDPAQLRTDQAFTQAYAA